MTLSGPAFHDFHSDLGALQLLYFRKLLCPAKLQGLYSRREDLS
jgi:hypothetical protein